MVESRSTGWPAFELVSVKVDRDKPRGAEILAVRGVPRRIVGHEFGALAEARLVADDPTGSLIAFGSSGLRGLVCLDIASGNVVHLPNQSALERNPVNSNVDRSIECAAAVIARFPFYDEDADPDQWEAVADELVAILGDIDLATELYNSFWVTFTDDVRIGDYSTAMIVDE